MKETEEERMARIVQEAGPKKAMNVLNVQEVLWDEIYRLRIEKTTAANLSAVTNATGKIMAAEVLKIKYAELTGRKPESKMLEDQTGE